MYIIVKYASDYFPDGEAPIECSIAYSFSARQVGVSKEAYKTLEEAENDLVKLIVFNPSVGYGIVKAI